MTEDEIELQQAIECVLRSKSHKKLVVAGPGTGKTTLFKALLKETSGNRDTHLVLTFINNLKTELETQLSDYAKVFTLHSYCLGSLYRDKRLRAGLSRNFRCQPGLASLIRSDWKYIHNSEVPHFVLQMRNLEERNDLGFYISRGNYYDAVDFDDSVFRVYNVVAGGVDALQSYDLVLIDEYQDFNGLEAGVIGLLGRKSAILIAGDDDQALYSQLRDSSWDYIRSLHGGGEFEVFELPFCMRCPKVVVDSVNDIIARARTLRKLEGRIQKPYRHFAPAKGADSLMYPTIALVGTSVQRKKANYFGKYIAKVIAGIPDAEVETAAREGYPAVLVIAAEPYRSQIIAHLSACGYSLDTKGGMEDPLDRASGLAMIKADQNSNLGWRIVIDKEPKKFSSFFVKQTADMKEPLNKVLPKEFVDKVLAEAQACELTASAEKDESKGSAVSPKVKITSFEGAKGLSAQHVFIAGLHNGEIPKDPANVEGIEVCRFVVGLTRTRKRCYLLYTNLFGQYAKEPSSFISWIPNARFECIAVDAAYWRTAAVGN